MIGLLVYAVILSDFTYRTRIENIFIAWFWFVYNKNYPSYNIIRILIFKMEPPYCYIQLISFVYLIICNGCIVYLCSTYYMHCMYNIEHIYVKYIYNVTNLRYLRLCIKVVTKFLIDVLNITYRSTFFILFYTFHVVFLQSLHRFFFNRYLIFGSIKLSFNLTWRCKSETFLIFVYLWYQNRKDIPRKCGYIFFSFPLEFLMPVTLI